MIGSLRRRILKRDFLEMRIDLGRFEPAAEVAKDTDITPFSEDLQGECIALLNSVGSLGYWNATRFKHEILDTVAMPATDIFLIRDRRAIGGISVLHRKDPKENRAEIGFVAVSPKSRGKKLGYRLLTHIVSEMKRRKIGFAYLWTDSFRIPAIRTYLVCGFRPHARSAIDARRWRKILEKHHLDPCR